MFVYIFFSGINFGLVGFIVFRFGYLGCLEVYNKWYYY